MTKELGAWNSEPVTAQRSDKRCGRVSPCPKPKERATVKKKIVTFCTEHEGQMNDGPFVYVGRDVGHEGQILDETARFTLWCVAWTKHAPLRGLESSWTRDFSGFLELRGNAGHHAESCNVGQAGEDMGDAGALHSEALDGPVACGDGAHESGGDVVAVHEELLEGVKLFGALCLFERFVDVHFELRVELFKEVFEHEREQLTSQFETLVADIVSVVDGGGVFHGHENTPHLFFL